jgi:hypothetical protein
VVAEGRGFFDAGSGARADVNLEGAGIHAGKKSWPSQGAMTANRATQIIRKYHDERLGVVDAEGEQADVSAADLLKVVFEAALKGDEGIAAGSSRFRRLHRCAP